MDAFRKITVNGEEYTFPSGHVFPFYADVQTLKIHECYKPDAIEHDVNSGVQQYITGVGSFNIGKFPNDVQEIENNDRGYFFGKVKLYSFNRKLSSKQNEENNITFFIKPVSILPVDQYPLKLVEETIVLSYGGGCWMSVYIPESIISHLVAEIKNVRLRNLGIGVEFTRNAYWASSSPDIYLIPSKDDDPILPKAVGKYRGLICSSNPKVFRLDELYSLARGMKSSLVRLGWIAIVLLILLLLFK